MNGEPLRCALVSSVALLVGLGVAGAADHRAAQTWPIQLGTSGGNVNDITRRYCCSGTLGGLVTDASGKKYILSNNHVLARVNQAKPGEDINQPGMVDQNCGSSGVLADLTKYFPIAFAGKGKQPINYVDAAIAEVRVRADGVSAVRDDGAILDIGTLSAEILADALNLGVCKSGRTTGLTVGTITGVDATIIVSYTKTCGGGATLKATFADQMVIGGAGFSAAGDSGSMIVEGAPAQGRPRAVGLLFAGNSSTTIANPIGRVLDSLGVTMVGEAAASSGVLIGGLDPLAQAKAAKARHSEKFLEVKGVHGHAVGLSKEGFLVVRIFVTPEDKDGALAQLPKDVDGVPVEVEVTEPFVAF